MQINSFNFRKNCTITIERFAETNTHCHFMVLLLFRVTNGNYNHAKCCIETIIISVVRRCQRLVLLIIIATAIYVTDVIIVPIVSINQ